LGTNEIIFYMENLEKLCIQGAKIDRLHPRPFASRVPLKKTSLKELTLLNCDVSSNTLREILTLVDRLKNFTFKGKDWNFIFPPGFDQRRCTEAYIRALATSTSNTLEYLDLDICERKPYSDFTSLEHLKHLTTSATIFHPKELDTDINRSGGFLPASLETLFLKDFDKEGLHIEELIKMLKNGQLPNLRTIKYAAFYDSDGFDNWESMKDHGWRHDIEQLWEYGIELSVGRCYDPSPMPENEDWPCDCWTYHHKARSLVLTS
jgi:hypothetical protein